MQAVAVRLALDVGEIDLAAEWMSCRERWVAWAGDVPGRAEQHLLEAECRRATGDSAGAQAAATRAREAASDLRQPLTLHAAHRLLGELATDTGHHAQAADHLREALTLAEACAAPYERALTLLALADLAAATGERQQAVQHLDEARAICAALDARPALRRADALAARLAATRDARLNLPAGLTAREAEVLRLVATGLTSRAIAERLFVGAVTVDNHIAHILTKTGCANRAEAAAFAQRHGLV
jgi:DNA-binding CsgD family transcriptional regulator